jgi:hypothetical protein
MHTYFLLEGPIFQKEDQLSKRRTSFPKGGPIVQKGDQLSKMRMNFQRNDKFSEDN